MAIAYSVLVSRPWRRASSSMAAEACDEEHGFGRKSQGKQSAVRSFTGTGQLVIFLDNIFMQVLAQGTGGGLSNATLSSVTLFSTVLQVPHAGPWVIGTQTTWLLQVNSPARDSGTCQSWGVAGSLRINLPILSKWLPPLSPPLNPSSFLSVTTTF
jgi:hypothetical protein